MAALNRRELTLPQKVRLGAARVEYFAAKAKDTQQRGLKQNLPSATSVADGEPAPLIGRAVTRAAEAVGVGGWSH